jgi:hypothetical protein
LPFSNAPVRRSSLLPLNALFAKRRRVFGFGVKEFGLIMSAFVAEPMNRLGERIGDPVFIPSIAAGDCFIGV